MTATQATKTHHCAVITKNSETSPRAVICTANYFWQTTCKYYAMDNTSDATCKYYRGELDDFINAPLCVCLSVRADFVERGLL